jgi:hypothetical protein
MMGRIYTNVAHLVIWLSPGDEFSDTALEILGLFKEQIGEDFNAWLTARIAADKRNLTCRSLAKLFSMPWFERAWVV